MIQWISLAASVLAVWGVQPGSTAVQESRLASWDAALDFEGDWAEERAASTLDSGGLRARVDLGRSPFQTGLRLTLEGAQPWTSAWMELGTLQGETLACVRGQALLTDAEGTARIDISGPIRCGLGVRFVARTSSGTVGRTCAVLLPGGGPRGLIGPQRGDVVITEIMKDPSFVTDTHGEWFEIQNITASVINIAGWRITDLGSNSHTISTVGQPIFLSPGQRFVLGIDQDPLTNGGVQVDYKYSNFSLSNGADSIILTARRGDLVDEVDYDDGILWPDDPGKTLSLHLFAGDVTLNDDPTNWCPGRTMIGGGNTDMGTPALDNDTCP